MHLPLWQLLFWPPLPFSKSQGWDDRYEAHLLVLYECLIESNTDFFFWDAANIGGERDGERYIRQFCQKNTSSGSKNMLFYLWKLVCVSWLVFVGVLFLKDHDKYESHGELFWPFMANPWSFILIFLSWEVCAFRDCGEVRKIFRKGTVNCVYLPLFTNTDMFRYWTL